MPTTPAAWFYDPATRQFAFNADGTAKTCHPIDQAVALATTVALKALASAPDTGADFDAIKSAPPQRQQATVTSAMQNALADRIAAGDITFFGAPIAVSGAGLIGFYVEYANLRLPKAPRVKSPLIKI